MVKQTIRLENIDGSIRCWLAPLEIERRLRNKEIRRVVEKGKAVRYRMVSYPPPSSSDMSAAQITASEMRMLPGLTEREMKRIAREVQQPKPDPRIVARVKLIQRWIGHGLIERNAVTELIAQA